jgi:hypothetical protein
VPPRALGGRRSPRSWGPHLSGQGVSVGQGTRHDWKIEKVRLDGAPQRFAVRPARNIPRRPVTEEWAQVRSEGRIRMGNGASTEQTSSPEYEPV